MCNTRNLSSFAGSRSTITVFQLEVTNIDSYLKVQTARAFPKSWVVLVHSVHRNIDSSVHLHAPHPPSISDLAKMHHIAEQLRARSSR